MSTHPVPVIPHTANDIASQLAKLAREMDDVVRMLMTADREAVEKRAAFDLAFSRAFIGADGSVDLRKHQATVATHQQRMDADVADALVRHLRRRLSSAERRIDVGRSLNAALRAEASLINQGADS